MRRRLSAALPEDLFRREIIFRDLTFSYVRRKPVLRHLNLTIAPGTTTALVGAIGAGKTTLVSLLLKLYTPDSGAVCFGDREIGGIPTAALRQHCAMAMQEPRLVEGTLAQNILYGREDADPEALNRALHAAKLEELVARLPWGLQTELTQTTDLVTEGEKQLICLARAFAADPEVLILDEATSSVDPYTEKQITEIIRDLARGRTTLIIAHRLTTVRDADRIVLLENGTVREDGTHDSLIQARGAYYRLYRNLWLET